MVCSVLTTTSSTKAVQLQQITDYLNAGGVAVDGVSIDPVADELTGISYKAPSDEQTALAAHLMAAFDWSEAARNIWMTAHLRKRAFAVMLQSNEPRDVMLRAILKLLFTEVNDLRELNGLQRRLEPERIAAIYAALEQGLGEV